MCDVTRKNFEDLYPSIQRNIARADFIALDCEFTGLKLSNFDRPSLFDSGEDRYKKLRKSVSQFSVSQIGVSAFVPDRSGISKYYAYTYNIYLFPASFGPIDVRFLCQASSMEFLCKHRFDFNKFMYEGVSYINDEQEEALKRHLDKMDHVKGLDREVDERSLQEQCSKVATWCVQAADGDTLTLESSIDVADVIIITELKQRFKNIWAQESEGRVIVEKVSLEKRRELSIKFELEEEGRIMDRMLGFTKVFRDIIRAKKPIVGHNCFTDLMLMYDKFYKPLPEKYSSFKRDICEMFPKVFDTKHIALNLRRPLEEASLLQYTGLGELYTSLSSEKGKFYVLYSPSISHGEGCTKYVGARQPHEAGYDAYMCGYVFLRMAHLYAVVGIKSSEVQPIAFPEYLSIIKCFTNHVNMIRAAVNNVRLDDLDPGSERPQLIFIQCRKLTDSITSEELARYFSAHGSVDIQLLGPRRALVAVSNHACFREILRAFRKHKTLCVVRYNPWRHSPIVRTLLWSGVLVFGSISVWTLLSGISTTRPTS